MPKILSAYSEKNKCGVDCSSDKRITKQSFKDECDVNGIVSRFMKTGTWSGSLAVSSRQPLFGDFTSVPEYREAMDAIIKAQNDFDAMPSAVRRRFNNDPAMLIEFLNDEKNLDEAVKLGLVIKKEIPVEKVVEPVEKVVEVAKPA